MKTHQFRFNAQLAEFNKTYNSVGVIYGGSETRLKEEIKQLTWPEAQAYLVEFHANAPAPSACSVTCMSNPKPRGYKDFKTMIYKEFATQPEALATV